MNKEIIINQDDIEKYRKDVINCLKLNGATDKEISLLKDETIKNAIRRNRSHEEVAWAILQ